MSQLVCDVSVSVDGYVAGPNQNMQGGTTFILVTEGVESALEQAQAAAGNRNVAIAGGAQTIVYRMAT